jgi:hypothetical protein
VVNARGTVRALAPGWAALAIASFGLPTTAGAACAPSGQFALVQANSGSGLTWRLTRGGEPLFVKGVAGPNQSRPAGGLVKFVSPYGAGAIAAMGGNALKTYGSDIKFGSDARGPGLPRGPCRQPAMSASRSRSASISCLRPFRAGFFPPDPNEPDGCTSFPIPADSGQTCKDSGQAYMRISR